MTAAQATLLHALSSHARLVAFLLVNQLLIKMPRSASAQNRAQVVRHLLTKIRPGSCVSRDSPQQTQRSTDYGRNLGLFALRPTQQIHTLHLHPCFFAIIIRAIPVPVSSAPSDERITASHLELYRDDGSCISDMRDSPYSNLPSAGAKTWGRSRSEAGRSLAAVLLAALAHELGRFQEALAVSTFEGESSDEVMSDLNLNRTRVRGVER